MQSLRGPSQSWAPRPQTVSERPAARDADGRPAVWTPGRHLPPAAAVHAALLPRAVRSPAPRPLSVLLVSVLLVVVLLSLLEVAVAVPRGVDGVFPWDGWGWAAQGAVLVGG